MRFFELPPHMCVHSAQLLRQRQREVFWSQRLPRSPHSRPLLLLLDPGHEMPQQVSFGLLISWNRSVFVCYYCFPSKYLTDSPRWNNPNECGRWRPCAHARVGEQQAWDGRAGVPRHQGDRHRCQACRLVLWSLFPTYLWCDLIKKAHGVTSNHEECDQCSKCRKNYIVTNQP